MEIQHVDVCVYACVKFAQLVSILRSGWNVLEVKTPHVQLWHRLALSHHVAGGCVSRL
jgi:hypothetical protein